jgi:nucleotide-binding universal stress UspA family protein
MAEVVVGVDGSPASQAALRWALDEVARRGGGRLHVAYAWEYPIAALAPSPVGTVVPPGDEMQAAANDALDTMLHDLDVDRITPAGVTVERAIGEGSPAQVILGLADEVDADLVVVGARGRGGFVGLLVGSVATQVVNHAKRPTVVVPPESAAGRGSADGETAK